MNVYGKSPEIKMETSMRRSFIAMALIILGTIIGRKTSQKQSKKEIQKNYEMSEKHFALFLMMNQWVKVKQEGKQLSEYLKKKGYKTIAIYEQNKNAIDYFVALCDKYAVQGNAAALQWCIKREIYPVVGASKPSQIIENVRSIYTEIPQEFWNELEGHKE